MANKKIMDFIKKQYNNRLVRNSVDSNGRKIEAGTDNLFKDLLK